MAKKQAKSTHPGRGWFTKAEAAAAFDVSEAFFDRHYRKLAPKDAVRDVDGRLYFQIRPIVDAVVAAEVEKATESKAKQQQDLEDDPLLAGAESPYLEEYRKYKAGQERIKLEQMLGTSIPRQELEVGLGKLAATLRQAGERVIRKFGNEAGEEIVEAVDEFEAACQTMLQVNVSDDVEPTDGVPAAVDGRTGPAAAAADDAGVRGT